MRLDTRYLTVPHFIISLVEGGIPVHDDMGRRIGTLQSPRAKPSSPKKGYAIVSLGGCLGMGEELRPVPWINLQYDPEAQLYVCDLDEELIRSAPIYTHDSNWSEARWSNRVKAHYALRPAMLAN